MGMPGKRMRLGTKSCAECRRRKVRCIVPPGQERCDACRAHGSRCVPQEKPAAPAAPGESDAASPSPSGADDVAALKKRVDELEALMRGLPADMRPRPPGSVHGAEAAGLTDGSTAASASPDDRSPLHALGDQVQHHHHTYPSLVDPAHVSPALQNSPLLQLFRASSIFSPLPPTTSTTPFPLPASASSSRLRRSLAHFAPYLPQPERVAALFSGTQQHWPIWPPYFPDSSSSERLGPGQVSLAERTFHSALVSGNPGATAKAILFLALCIQQTPKRHLQSLIPPSVRQQDLVDTYVETAQELLQLDGGGTLDGVEAMNLLYKICINAGRPQRAWSWNRAAITASLCCGLPSRAAAAGEGRAAYAWSLAWRAERYMAMTLGLPSSTSALHPGLAPLPAETTVTAIMHYLAVACGKIIDRDQNHNDEYAATLRLGDEMEDARGRLFPASWWAADHLRDLDQAAGWHRQSTKIVFLTALQVLHLPYLLRAATDTQFAPSWDAGMRASRDICFAYREFRQWPRGGGELCQVMDFRAFSAALILLLGHWIAPALSTTSSSSSAADTDALLVRDVALCLRQTAAVMECQVAEQAVRTLDALDAARRGTYMAEEDYEVAVPYFGRIRINKAFFERKEDGAAAAAAEWFNTVAFETNDFLADFQFDAAGELCHDWGEVGVGWADMDWDRSFTCGPFVDVDGARAE